MASITTRAGKGSPLTNAELDANFNNINAQLSTAVITGGTIDGATIGATTATTGKFSQLDVDNLRLDGNTISSTDTNGNVTIAPNGTGIATFSKATVVSTTDNTNAALRITQLGTGNALLVEDSSNPDSTPTVITGAGQVVIGNTAGVATGGFTVAPFQIQAVSSGLATSSTTAWNAGVDVGSNILLARSAGSTVGDYTTVASGNTLGNLRFYGADGTAFIEAAKITAAVDGTPGTNDMPGRLVFSTTADGASSPTERMRLDSSGNLGLGVTPSAWRTSEYKAVQVGIGASFYGRVTAGDQDKAGFSANAFYDQTDNRWEYIATDSASRYDQLGGGHYWYTAPSGTAGNAISFTQAMTLDASGNLGIGTSSPAYRLDISSSAESSLRVNSAAGYDTVLRLAANGTNKWALFNESATDDFVFYSNATTAERLRLTDTGNVGIGTSSPTHKLSLAGTADNVNSQILVTATGVASGYLGSNSNGFNIGTDTAGIIFKTGVTGGGSVGNTGTERARIDSSGNLLVGGTSQSGTANRAAVFSANKFGLSVIDTTAQTTGVGGALNLGGNYRSTGDAQAFCRVAAAKENSTDGNFAYAMTFATTPNGGTFTEAARIDSSGNLLVGKTATSGNTVGSEMQPNGLILATRSGGIVGYFNRQTNDGTLIEFAQANITEGTISVSGTTVSYNGGHLSRWAQTTTAKDESLVKGTVLSNLDEMNVYTDAEGNTVENEQLNKVKVSDVEGDANVAGVFVNWEHDEAHDVDEINMAMTGDMIIRIAQGVTVARGDLLMSAGDGTAKPQGDDIVRSKTVAKVTSTHVTCTYADGSYCVPCVLMAC